VVLPIHNERESLRPLLEEIAAALRDRPYEVIAVDDASVDGSRDELQRCRAAFPGLRVLHLPERAGQSAATMAGVDAAGGDIVVTLDADGQNDPADIPRLLEPLLLAPSVAAAVGYRHGPRESAWRAVQSRFANRVRDWITGDRVKDSACGFRAARRSVLSGLPRFNGMHRFMPTLIRHQGGVVVEVPVTPRPRRHGASKYRTWERAVRGLFDALGVRWLGRRAMHRQPPELER
jgi:glycosyltransferase involved in cell wall biosynthesis